ncbi:hypothetical protein [Prochlorococcus sp. MIT 0916]
MADIYGVSPSTVRRWSVQ